MDFDHDYIKLSNQKRLQLCNAGLPRLGPDTVLVLATKIDKSLYFLIFFLIIGSSITYPCGSGISVAGNVIVVST